MSEYLKLKYKLMTIYETHKINERIRFDLHTKKTFMSND